MNDSDRDRILTEIRVDVADIKARIEAVPDHENRIRSLERFRYSVPGTAILGVLLAIAGLAVPHF